MHLRFLSLTIICTQNTKWFSSNLPKNKERIVPIVMITYEHHNLNQTGRFKEREKKLDYTSCEHVFYSLQSPLTKYLFYNKGSIKGSHIVINLVPKLKKKMYFPPQHALTPASTINIGIRFLCSHNPPPKPFGLICLISFLFL